METYRGSPYQSRVAPAGPESSPELAPSLGSLSPVFSSDAGTPGRLARNVFFPDHMDLSDALHTAPAASLESRLLQLCNKRFVSEVTWAARDEDDRKPILEERAQKFIHELTWPSDRSKTVHSGVFSDGDIPGGDLDDDDDDDDDDWDAGASSPWLRSISRSISHHYDQRRGSKTPSERTRSVSSRGGLYRTDGMYGQKLCPPRARAPLANVFSNCPISPSRGVGDDAGPRKHMTDDDIKDAVVKIKADLIKLREDDRKLLKQFIQIRFGIEYLDNKTRGRSLASCRDLTLLGTLPRSPPPSGDTHQPPPFRQRALSLKTTTLHSQGVPVSAYSHLRRCPIKEL